MTVPKVIMTGNRKGYALIAAIIAINLVAIFSLVTASLWQRKGEREMENELFFRANEYVRAIENYRKKNLNRYPKNLEDLYRKKFVRKLYRDPISSAGKWNMVMMSRKSGKKSLLIVPLELLEKFIKTAYLIGVSSTSIDEGYRVYRGKSRYDEWAFYLGQKIDKDMPELKFILE